MSKYILKNKDKNVLEFEVEIDNGIVREKKINYVSLKNAAIISKELLPKSLSEKNLLSSLKSWIKQRKIPEHRMFANNILTSIPTNISDNFMAYIDISFGLSLNDSFWIIPADKDYKWKDYNLYKNEFSEALALSAFGLKMTKVNGFTSSPEYTTNGMLKKCWHRDNDKIYLYKGNTEKSNDGREYGGKEAYSEYYMAQVAKIMEFDSVPYDLKMFHNELVSTCPIFTNENEGYLPIHLFLNKSFEDYNKDSLIEEITTLYGKEAFDDLMVFDALICNIDRHLGNFGMIVDNNTGEILRPAPIFDNGLSIINLLYKNELQDIHRAISVSKSYLELKFDEQLEIFVNPRHAQNLQKLSNFTFKRHKEFNLSEEWLKPIEECIRTRAKMALNFIEEKQNTSIQNHTQIKNQNPHNEPKEENLSLKEINTKLDKATQKQNLRASKPKPNYEEQETIETNNENLENSHNQNSNKKLNKRR